MQLKNIKQSKIERFLAKFIYLITLKKIDFRLEKQIFKFRSFLGQKIFNQSDGRVMYGPFKGMKVDKDLSWGTASLSGKLLGLYENGVLKELDKILKEEKIQTFINLGAADGFFSVGVARNKKIKKCICFEINKNSHKSIIRNAKKNNVFEKFSIFGEASTEDLVNLDWDSLGNCLLLSDIEGCEYELFNNQLIKKMNNCILIIEIHDDFKKLDKLKENLQKYFLIDIIYQDDSSSCKFIREFTDFERAIIRMEGRHYEGQWLICRNKLTFNK